MLYLFFIFILTFSSSAQSQQLSVLNSYTLPVSEISGMAWRSNPKTKKRELVVVGDRHYSLYIVDWDNRDPELKITTVDLSHTKTSDDSKQSEWESVFCDESGRVYLLKESPSRILVTDPELKKIERVINLPNSTQAINSGPEGVSLLKNGHILVVNEKDPLQIIEYGPSGTKALGYHPKLSLESGGHFPIDDRKYVPLFKWDLDKVSLASLEDSSGINTDKDGNLYLLSDQKNSIGLIGAHLDPKKKTLKVSKLWSLPKNLKQPEGMVIDEKNRPIIAIDRKKTNKTNLFLLSPLK